MRKIFVSLLLILELFSCKPKRESLDYFSQILPNSIPKIFAPDVVSVKGRFEHGISFTPDTREAVFGVLNKENFSGKIYYSERVDFHWTEPSIFKPLENESVHLPYFSPNGKSLLFAKDKPNSTEGNSDIWIIERKDDTWDVPKKLQSPISSSSREANASMTMKGTIYFSSNRNCNGKENCYTADLFYSELIYGKYQDVKAISECNSQTDEESIFISPEEDYMIFCRYTDNETWMDLYITYRDKNNLWIEPKLIDSTINSKDWDRRPFVSSDNKFLFFTRLQMGEKGLTESDIYWVNTSKLFKPFIYHPMADLTLQIGKKFEVSLPENYFKDVDGEKLNVSINQEEFDWLEFDHNKMKLSGLPTFEGDFDLFITAIDEFSNKAEHKINLKVIN